MVQRALPALEHLVLIDCPDPDTTEDAAAPGTSLARLRPILPHCDVLLVVTTQQKYRSARVGDELAAACAGARLLFVQTHADVEQDIRDDWRRVLASHYAPGELFYVDSLRALGDGVRPAGVDASSEERNEFRSTGGDFARLQDLLTRQLSGGAGNRIRRANFLDLVDDTLASAAARLAAAMPAVEQLWDAIDHQRAALGVRLARQTHDELLVHRRQWESRLVARVVSRWGFSPFSLVLRVFQGLGGLLSAPGCSPRTPAQLALWGVFEGARGWRQRRARRQAEQAAVRAAGACWEKDQLHGAALVLAGYAAEAGIERPAATRGKTDIPVGLEAIDEEAGRSTLAFAGEVSAALDRVLDRLAARHSGFFTRWFYELLLLAMLGFLGFRLAKNFFYDTWLGVQPYGLDFYVQSAFWLLAWCLLLYWMFAARLRRGLRREIDQWRKLGAATPAAGLFGRLQRDCRDIERFNGELEDSPPPRGPVTRSLCAARGPAGPGPGGAASPGFLSRSIRRSAISAWDRFLTCRDRLKTCPTATCRSLGRLLTCAGIGGFEMLVHDWNVLAGWGE